MMIYLVKRFTEIYCAKIYCVPSLNETLNDLADSVQSMATSHPFLKTKLLIMSV